VSTRAAAIGVLFLALSGLAGAWSAMGAPIVVALLLLPGYALAGLLDEQGGEDGPWRLGLAFSLSMAVFSAAATIATVTAIGWVASSRLFAVMLLILGVGAWWGAPREREGNVRREWIGLLVAIGILLPPVVRFAGGGVDDWWDLAYVRALADRPAIDFREPWLGTGRMHPRFSWNAWLLFQAAAREWTGADSVRLQSQVLAPVVCVGSVSAAMLLARAVFAGARASAMVLTALAVIPWVYATDALPYFTRLHQDKFVAALVLTPVLVATALGYIAQPTRRHATLVGLTAIALCSVHTLVFGIGALGVVVCAVTGFWSAREGRGWYTVRHGVFEPRHALVLALLLALPLLLPLWQAWTLREWFADQGVGLAMPDNPVVRAHLALGRLIAAGSPYMIVNPSAVFGPIGIVVAWGGWLAWRSRRPGDLYLVALALVPAAVLFTPVLAAAIGTITVPWMLYRIGWLIPQPLLIARVLLAALSWKRRAWRAVAFAGCTLIVVAVTLPTAADRFRRRMREHPFTHEIFPRGMTLAAYRFLDDAKRPGAVVAPAGFSNLVPAMTGRGVLAFSERGTLVFAGSEPAAYARLRDRATFFSCATRAATRQQIADDYGVAYAVFRRRYRTAGDEMSWLDRATSDGVLLAADASVPVDCARSEDRLREIVPAAWRIVFANSDYFVVETDAATRTAVASTTESGGWLEVLGVESADPRDEGDILASATVYPGGSISLDPVPAGYGIGSELLWAAGGALWDDGPVEVSVELRPGGRCPVTAVEIVPYLETRRREVLEVRTEDRVRAVHARDGVPRRIALERRLRDSVRVVIRSRLGLPFGLSDVRLLGDRAACVDGWRPLARPELVGQPPALASYVALASTYPRSPRVAADLASRIAAVTSAEDAIATLRRGLAREPGQAAPWIELGLRLDAVGRFEEARRAYRRARAADSNSAWAHGCLAWADLRAGRRLTALWHAWRAEQLDPRYADAVTIAGLAWEQLGSESMSIRALDRAIHMAPRRGWAYFERARQLAARGQPEEARALLRRYRALVPDDPMVNERLRALAGGESRNG